MSSDYFVHRGEVLFVLILFCFSSGILTGSFDKDKLHYVFWASGTIMALLSVLSIYYNNLSLYRYKKTIGILCYLLIYLLGLIYSSWYKQDYSSSYFGKFKSDYLKVVINQEPQQKAGIIRFSANVVRIYRQGEQHPVQGKILIALLIDTLKPPSLFYGDELMIPSRFTAVGPPYNPSEFNVKTWLAAQNIYHQTFLPSNQIIKLSNKKGNLIVNYALELRQKQIAIYRSLLKDDKAFAVASTLILGYRSDLSTETLDAYSTTGTIHALSVSGMHVGIIYIVLNWALSFMNRNGVLSILKLVFILLLIWFYSLITGFCPAVLRSAIMLSVYIISKFFSRNSNNYNVLAFSAFVLLMWNPFLIWDVGFQLSFISVFGLIYLQPKIYHVLNCRNRWIDKTWSLTSLSIAAQVVTFPLSVYYFHQFPIYFLLGNLFITLPLTVMMYMGLALLLFKLYFLAPAFEWIIIFTNAGLSWISNLPLSSLSSIWISNFELCLLSLFIILFILALNLHSKKMLMTSLTILLFLQSLLVHNKIKAGKQEKIIFFSLNKNYAAAFITSNTAVLLTDLVTNDQAFKFFIKPALDQHNIRYLKFIKWTSDIKTPVLEISGHQIIFNRYRILKFDPCFNFKIISGQPQIDAIWLHDNPRFNLKELKKQINIKRVIIDASNKAYRLKDYTKSIKLFHLNYHILKKNKAYLIKLN